MPRAIRRATRAISCSPPRRRQLDFLRFPLGDMEKNAVRELAAELGLVTAAKPDSQDICFVPDGRYTGIVEKLRPDAARPGEIVDQAGTVLGRHDGIIHFTVGQRKGLGLSGNGEPLFVLKLDAARARVVVGPRAALASQSSICATSTGSSEADRRDRLRGQGALDARRRWPARVEPLADGGARVDAGGGGRGDRAGPGLCLL